MNYFDSFEVAKICIFWLILNCASRAATQQLWVILNRRLFLGGRSLKLGTTGLFSVWKLLSS
jgi:hypothetical protein